jgi:hypothetical protein
MTERTTTEQKRRRDRPIDPDTAAAARQRARDRAADDDLPRKSGAPPKQGAGRSS